jgi:Fimbrial assembly protein (PilN)
MSQQINLFNPTFAKQSKLLSTQAVWQGLAVAMLGVVLFYAYASYQAYVLTQQADASNKQLAAVQATLTGQVDGFSPQKANQLIEEEIKKIEAQVAIQQEMLGTLQGGNMGNTTGYSEYMRAFARQSVSGLWLTGFTMMGNASQMALQGAAVNAELVPAYIRHLSQEPIMRGKSFAVLHIEQSKLDAKANSAAVTPRYLEFSLQSSDVAASNGTKKP